MKKAVVALLLLLANLVHSSPIDVGRNTYAAIAYSPGTGKYAYACDLRSRKSAEQAALEKCGEADSKIACWINYGFCSLALGSDKAFWGVGWVYGGGSKVKDAEDKALANCRERTTGANIAVTVSSDGQFVWDRKDHVTITDSKGNVYDGNGKMITPSPSSNSLFDAIEAASKKEEPAKKK